MKNYSPFRVKIAFLFLLLNGFVFGEGDSLNRIQVDYPTYRMLFEGPTGEFISEVEAKFEGDQKKVTLSKGLFHYYQGSFDQASMEFQSLLGSGSCNPIQAYAEAYDGLIDIRTGNWEDGRKGLTNASFCFQQIKDKVGEADVLILSAQGYHFKGLYSKAITNIFKAEKILKSIDDVDGQIEAINLKAHISNEIGAYSESRVMLLDGLKLLKKNRLTNKRLESNLCQHLAQAYMGLGKYSIAKQYTELSLKINDENEMVMGQLSDMLLLSELYDLTADHTSAKRYLNQSISILSRYGFDGDLRNRVDLRNAEHLLLSGEEKESIVLVEHLVNVANEGNINPLLLKSYQLLSDAYYGLSDYQNAFVYKSKYIELNEKMGSGKAARLFDELASITETSIKNEKIVLDKADQEIKEAEIKTDKVVKYSAIALLILLVIFLALLYRQILIKQGANEKLAQRNQVINKQNLELRKMNSVLEEAKKEAEAGLQAKTNFLAMTSHEIRTPMNGIMGMASLMLESNLDKNQRKYVETIQTSSENLLIILNDILDFSKIEAGKMNIETKLIDLDGLFEEVITIFSKQAKDKNIKLDKSLGNAMIRYFRGDILRIRQVLINLVSNAVKFTENGTITLSMDLEELLGQSDSGSKLARLKFTVEDDGIGISNEKQQKIFESFEQEDTSTSRKYGGIGLGLSISKKLVELMGGNIGLVSEKGVGTTFYFVLNVEIPDKASSEKPINASLNAPVNQPEAIKAAPKKVKLSDNNPLRILVAEDNPFNKLFIEKLFEKFGYEDFLHAENGIEVLSCLKDEEVDVILMDIQMPEMDGKEATKRIISEYGDKRPKIIALTADASEIGKQEYLDLGMDGFLSKPFKAEELKEILMKISSEKEQLMASV